MEAVAVFGGQIGIWNLSNMFDRFKIFYACKQANSAQTGWFNGMS